jgi:hypothetical protein
MTPLRRTTFNYFLKSFANIPLVVFKSILFLYFNEKDEEKNGGGGDASYVLSFQSSFIKRTSLPGTIEEQYCSLLNTIILAFFFFSFIMSRIEPLHLASYEGQQEVTEISPFKTSIINQPLVNNKIK